MLRFSDFDRDGKNIYYNIGVVNKNQQPTEFRYFDKRGTSLVPNGKRYKLAVERFSIDTSEIPIMYFPSTQFNAFALNETYTTADNNFYSITVSDPAGVSRAYLQHESFTSNPSDLRIFTVDQFVQILNKAMRTACNGLTQIDQNFIPYFYYDESVSIIHLVAPGTWSLLANPKFNLYMNDKLWKLFENFAHTKTDLDQGRTYRIDVYNTGNNLHTSSICTTRNSVINAQAGTQAFLIRGQWCTIFKLFQLRNLIFTTNSIPIRSEFLNNSFDFTSSTSFGSQRILKNFEFNLESVNALYSRGIQNFVANDREWIDLEDSNELTTVDLQIFYSDVHGKVFPLEVPSGSLTTIKLLFKEIS